MNDEQEKMVLDNMNFVYYIINEYFHGYINDEDIKQTGMVGLCKAAATFDNNKNIKFATYASKCIYNEILLFFRSINNQINIISLEYEIDNTENLTLSDVIEDKNNNINNWIDTYNTLEILERLYTKLTPIEFRVLNEYKISKNQTEIANKLGISQRYISTILNKIKKKYDKIK